MAAGDEGPPDREKRGRLAASRRMFLKTTGATAAVTALAGCGGTQSRRFVAAPAVLADPEGMGYALADEQSPTETLEREVAGTTYRVTIENTLRAYEGDDGRWAGTLTSPSAEVVGQSFNPLSGLSLVDLVDGYGDDLLTATVLTDQNSVGWRRGPASVDEFGGDLLGDDVTCRTLVGATEGGDVVLLHAARTTNEGDIVVAASLRSYPAPEPLPDAPDDLLGAGEVPGGDRLATHQGGFAELLPTVEHPGEGTDTEAPSATATEPGEEDRRTILTDVQRRSMGGGRERITGVFERFEDGELVRERVALDDLGFRQSLRDRSPNEGADVISDVPMPSPTPAEASLAARIGRTLGAATAAFGLTGGVDTTDSMAEPHGPLPDSVSLRSEQTPLKSQGGRGTCVSFGICAALEAAYKRAGYGTLDLSEQYANHLQKMAYLHSAGNRNADGTLGNNGFENFLGSGGGSALGYMLPLLKMYGIPKETDAQYQPSSAGNPGYIFDGDYSNTSQQGDSFQAYVWNNPSSIRQDRLNDFNLGDVMLSYQISPSRTRFRHVPFPPKAQQEAHYGIDSYVHVSDGGRYGHVLKRPFVFERLLAHGFEVMIGYSHGQTQWAEPKPSKHDHGWPKNYSGSGQPSGYDEAAHEQAIQDWKDDDGNVYVYDSSGSGGGHCVTLVGYDTTGSQNYFVAKNSWNTYTKMGYDLFTNGVLGEAAYIRAVNDPKPGEFHHQDFLGRYDMAYDGGSGTLDLYRLPNFFDPDKLPGGKGAASADLRVGSFTTEDGDIYRVNGEIVRRGPTPYSTYDSFAELHLYIDFGDQNQPYDSKAGTEFVATMNVADPSLMAGRVEPSQYTQRGGFHAEDQGIGSGTPGVSSPSIDAMLGEWEIFSPFHTEDATLVVTSVDQFDDEFTGRVREDSTSERLSDFADPVTGSVDYVTGDVRLQLGSDQLAPNGTPGTLDGYLHTDTRSVISGVYTVDSGDRAPVVLTRDDVEPFVEITSPSDGATISGGKGSQLDAFVVGQPGATVRWRATDQSTGQTTIVGTGDSITPALSSGTFDIEASYTGSAPYGAKTTDTITVTVSSGSKSGGDIDIRIFEPTDGELVTRIDGTAPDGNLYIDLQLDGLARGGDGTMLSGSALQWEYRQLGETSWTGAGTGETTTVRLKDVERGSTTYEIRMTATDSAGNSESETHTVRVRL